MSQPGTTPTITLQDTKICHKIPDKARLAPSIASPVAPALEKWNQPSVNRNRYFATVFGLTVMGLNDACLGALIPYVRSRLSVCLVFLLK